MMGGSGGGGSYYGGGGGSGGIGGGGGSRGGPIDPDLCNLTINATIHAPNTDYVNALNLGAILSVALGGPNGRTIEVRTPTDYLIGSLIGLSRAAQLIECIQAGNVYTAEVVAINSGVFGVVVRRAP